MNRRALLAKTLYQERSTVVLMDPLRQALVNHIEILRDFVMEVLQVDSGLYNVEDLNIIIVKPDTIVRLETDWIKGLLELLQMIQQYIQLVERWASHVYGLAQNLGVTPEELLQLERQEKQASDILPSKSQDRDYLSWIMTDISGEVERLIASTQELTTAAPRLLELTSQYGGPFLDRVQQIGQAWLASGRREF